MWTRAKKNLTFILTTHFSGFFPRLPEHWHQHGGVHGGDQGHFRFLQREHQCGVPSGQQGRGRVQVSHVRVENGAYLIGSHRKPHACISHHTTPCLRAQYLYPYITSNMFVLNSFEDAWQDGCILTAMPVAPNNPGMDWNCSSAPGYAGVCTTPNPKCSPIQIADAFIPFGTRMRTLFSGSRKAATPGNGGFLHSCAMHCEGQSTGPFTTIKVGGVTMKDEVTKWLASGFTAPAMWTVDLPLNPTAPYASNPTCPAAVERGSFDLN